MPPQTALVTGGADRLGAAMVRLLAQQGYDVIVQYRSNEAAAKALQSELAPLPVKIHLKQADFDDTETRANFMKDLLRVYPDLKTWIHTASVFEKTCLQDTSECSYDKHMDIHVKTTLFMAQEFAKHVNDGQIILFLDTRIQTNATTHFAYTLSKKSMRSLMKLLAVELAPNIRVNAIAPGYILPAVGRDHTQSTHHALLEKIPLQRQGSVDDIMNAAQYLLQASYVTGQILFIDGGEHL